MDVLVTGCNGFIGTHLVRRLWQDGCRITGVDRRAPDVSRLDLCIAPAARRYTFRHGDVNDADFVDRLFRTAPRFDVAFHLAAIVGVRRTLESPGAVQNDARGIENICRASAASRVGRLVFASSSEVYGEPRIVPTPESLVPTPLQPYAAVKVFGESMLANHRREFGLPGTAVRLFNVYGPGQEAGEYGFVVADFVDRLARGARLQIFGDGSQTRDFVYVEDCVRGLLLAATHPAADGAVLNLGNGVATTVLDLARRILAMDHRDAEAGLEFLPRRQDIFHRVADARRIRELGYRPAVELQDGLERTWEHWRRRAGRIYPLPAMDLAQHLEGFREPDAGFHAAQ